MASQILRTQTLVDRVITIKISLSAKDGTDDSLIKKFGDIKIVVSGTFCDPNDGTYPPFRVDAGDDVLFFTAGEIKTTFVNDTLLLADLQKRADLWGDAIQLDIQNKMIALRALSDTTTSSSTVTI